MREVNEIVKEIAIFYTLILFRKFEYNTMWWIFKGIILIILQISIVFIYMCIYVHMYESCFNRNNLIAFKITLLQICDRLNAQI